MTRVTLSMCLLLLTILTPAASTTVYNLVLPFASDMVFVQGGTFIMGDSWGNRCDNQSPPHEVTLTYSFLIGKYPVTFDEFDLFCVETGRTKPHDGPTSTEGWGRANRPVINIGWLDAMAYCNWLSDRQSVPRAYNDSGVFIDKLGNETMNPAEVIGFRLPTEAEWEFAARGGNRSEGYIYAGSDIPQDVAWYAADSQSRTHEVGLKLPNELGIYDMSGNVWEWCSDSYTSYNVMPVLNSYKKTDSFYMVLRGGCWADDEAGITVTARERGPAENGTSHGVGFRVAITAQSEDISQNYVTNIRFEPESPAVLGVGERVRFTFDYSITNPDGVRIWCMPYTNRYGSRDFAVGGSPLYPQGSGQGSGYFMLTTAGEVDELHIYMKDADGNVLCEVLISVDYRFIDAP